jgi:hypothetical protein
MMDEARLNDFMGKLVSDMGGAAMLANVILGEELRQSASHPRSTRREDRLQHPPAA